MTSPIRSSFRIGGSSSIRPYGRISFDPRSREGSDAPSIAHSVSKEIRTIRARPSIRPQPEMFRATGSLEYRIDLNGFWEVRTGRENQARLRFVLSGRLRRSAARRDLGPASHRRVLDTPAPIHSETLSAGPSRNSLSCAWWLTLEFRRWATAGNVKLLLPPRRRRGVSLGGLVTPGTSLASLASDFHIHLVAQKLGRGCQPTAFCQSCLALTHF